MEVHVAA